MAYGICILIKDYSNLHEAAQFLSHKFWREKTTTQCAKILKEARAKNYFPLELASLCSKTMAEEIRQTAPKSIVLEYIDTTPKVEYKIERHWVGVKTGELWKDLETAQRDGKDPMYRRHSLLFKNKEFRGYFFHVHTNIYILQSNKHGDRVVNSLKSAFEKYSPYPTA